MRNGRGVVNILAADRLLNSPRLYATFLLWLLSELFERLPEVGDPEKPKLVFFFDEAHLLFDEAPTVLLEKHRAGGAADALQGRRRVLRHAEPAGHPRQRARPAGQPRAARAARLHARATRRPCKAAAETMRPKPGLDIAAAITELAVGEALVSFLDDKGRPSVDRAAVRDPAGQPDRARSRRSSARRCSRNSLVAGRVREDADRESAYEKLKGRARGSPGGPGGSARQPAWRRGAGRWGARRPVRRAVRLHRPARRQARRPGRKLRQVGHPDRRQLGRPRDRAGGAGGHPRREAAVAATRGIGPRIP